jgi:tRNA(fMet)-specific endonuclease VapC
MDSVLLDTDVFSLFFRRDTRSLLYDSDVRDKIRCLSFASVAELRFGALVGGWNEPRRQQLEVAIERTVILPGDNQTTLHWALVRAARQRLGRPIASEDCWIAATALRHQIPLITHNGRDYENIPHLKLLSHGS